jgi:hypothetical protein
MRPRMYACCAPAAVMATMDCGSGRGSWRGRGDTPMMLQSPGNAISRFDSKLSGCHTPLSVVLHIRLSLGFSFAL